MTAEQAEMLGRFVVEWSNIEFLLGELLGRLLFTPSFLSRVYGDELTAYRIQSALEKAVIIHKVRYGCTVIPHETLDRIEGLRISIDRLRGMRNRFSHFCWTRQTDEAIFGTSFSAFLPHDKRHEKDYRLLSLDEIKEAHKEAWNLVEEISEVIKSIPEYTEEEMLKAKAGVLDA
ncbi:MAG: hypothetical protein P4L51_27225 [Puia sp.]|nr:hypothetical protein [Puia sp.]